MNMPRIIRYKKKGKRRKKKKERKREEKGEKQEKKHFSTANLSGKPK